MQLLVYCSKPFVKLLAGLKQQSS
uniref:Uncharacterized protein n=1 Tax=Anguilla anguilla TaxID=7936 RepID=A0A0E9UB40_ANGAN